MEHRASGSGSAARAISAEDESRLAEGLIAGRREAVSEFLDRTHHPVFCMACRFTTDPDLRQDWTHAVLLGILEDLDGGRFVYRRPGSFWAWFRKRAHYRLLDEYRRRSRTTRRESPLEASGEPQDAIEIPGGADPAAEMETVELVAAIEACLSKLPNPDQRRALALLLLEDLPYQEIAVAMVTPLNTVRAWIRRGRLALRKCLAQSRGLNPTTPEE